MNSKNKKSVSAAAAATPAKAAKATPATVKGASPRAAKAAPAKPAKVGAIDKAAKAAPAKSAKASGQGQGQGQAAPRGQYAGKKITVTELGKSATVRGNRAVRWELVKAAKNTNDVLGKSFDRATDGESQTVTAAGIRNFVKRGFITLS
jgi:hypothetical protein